MFNITRRAAWAPKGNGKRCGCKFSFQKHDRVKFFVLQCVSVLDPFLKVMGKKRYFIGKTVKIIG